MKPAELFLVFLMITTFCAMTVAATGVDDWPVALAFGSAIGAAIGLALFGGRPRN